MEPVNFILLLIAAVCFGLAAFSVSVHPKLNLVALGLLAWVLTVLIPAGKAL